MSNKIKTSLNNPKPLIIQGFRPKKKNFKLEIKKIIKKSKKWEIFSLIPINQKYNKIKPKNKIKKKSK